MAENTGVMKKFAQKLKTNRKLEIVVYGVIIAAALGIYLSSVIKPATSSTTRQSSGTTASESEQIEEKIVKTLSQIRGVGKVDVLITYETGPELVPAMNVERKTTQSEDGGSGSSASEDESSRPVTIKDGSTDAPLVLTEKMPKVRGVIVVAEGAGDIRVKLSLIRAVQTLLDVNVNSIEVFEMQDTN